MPQHPMLDAISTALDEASAVARTMLPDDPTARLAVLGVLVNRAFKELATEGRARAFDGWVSVCRDNLNKGN